LSQTFPKGSLYEKGKKGEDNSWKLAIHVHFAMANQQRVHATVMEFKCLGGVRRLFGEQSLLEEVVMDYQDVGGRDAFRRLIPGHQNKNQSVGSAILHGFIDINIQVPMFFEQAVEGKVRHIKMMCFRDIMGKLYNKIGGRKYPVFLYCFRNFRGQYQIWFWDKSLEMREFTSVHLKVLAAYMWQMTRRWGWDTTCCRCLFKASLDSETAASTIN